MASFNVSGNFGSFMAKQGFRVESNRGPGSRPNRLFAPEPLKGKTAKKWFNKVFWICHKRWPCGNDCCEIVVPTI
jgi:hypothetical protein